MPHIAEVRAESRKNIDPVSRSEEASLRLVKRVGRRQLRFVQSPVETAATAAATPTTFSVTILNGLAQDVPKIILYYAYPGSQGAQLESDNVPAGNAVKFNVGPFNPGVNFLIEVLWRDNAGPRDDLLPASGTYMIDAAGANSYVLGYDADGPPEVTGG